MSTDIEKREVYRAIAEMAYVIAKADHGLSAEERIAFRTIIQEELDYDSWAAQSRFELLDEITEPSIEKVYNEAIHDFRLHKRVFTEELKEKVLRVVKRLAEVCNGLSDKEAFIMDRLRHDLNNL